MQEGYVRLREGLPGFRVPGFRAQIGPPHLLLFLGFAWRTYRPNQDRDGDAELACSVGRMGDTSRRRFRIRWKRPFRSSTPSRTGPK